MAIMTFEELQALTIQNTQAIARIASSIENQERVNNEAFAQLMTIAENQERKLELQNENLRANTQTMLEMAESQSRSIDSQRDSIGSNAEIMANAIQLAAIYQRTAAAAQEQGAVILEISANTTRSINLLEQSIILLKQTHDQNIDRLEKMVEIIIKDNQADRERIRNMENRP
jgi:Tfp pilus assembly protein PilE